MNNTRSFSSPQAINWGILYAAELFTVVFLSILALLTTTINGFTLYAIYKDPMRCFRTPLTTFISGIILFDFLTGIIVEPSVAAVYAISYSHHEITRKTYVQLVRIAQAFSLVTMNSSFVTFLALAIAQFIAIAFPRIYEKFFTVTRCRIIVAGIWVYSIFFAILPEMFKIAIYKYFIADLIIHNTLVSLVLIIIYIAMFLVLNFKIAPTMENAERNQDQASPDDREQTPQFQREFLMGTFLLTLILILTVFPITIALYIWIFQARGSIEIVIQKYVAVVFCENILFLKFLWDPAILILRVPTYRKSVVTICNAILPGGNAGGVVAYNRHADEEDRNENETIAEDDSRSPSRNDVKA